MTATKVKVNDCVVNLMIDLGPIS